jgi:hypothetical protein
MLNKANVTSSNLSLLYGHVKKKKKKSEQNTHITKIQKTFSALFQAGAYILIKSGLKKLFSNKLCHKDFVNMSFD